MAAIRHDPASWLGLMVRKTYYLFNDFEQYNNKTFSVQKALSPVLSPNPLGWGLTFVFCVAGVALAIVDRRRFAMSAFLIGVAGLYGAGVILFFVSDRFRLPLLPFICIGTGAWGLASWRWLGYFHLRQSMAPSRPANLMVPASILAAGLLTFSRGWGVHDLKPSVQDHILLSMAEGKAGQDLEGLRWARRALEESPDHPDAMARAVTSFYNLKIQGVSPEREFPDETWQLQAERVARIPQPAPGVRLVQAVALWKTDHKVEAKNVLHGLLASIPAKGTSADAGDDPLGVLLLSGLGDSDDRARARLRLNQTASPYLLVGFARQEAAASALIPAASKETLFRAEPLMRNVFP
jgi:hypothetical protein